MTDKNRKEPRSFGTWRSSLSPAEVAGQIRLQDVRWDSDSLDLVWLEERSDRGVLVVKKQTSSGIRDLTRAHSVKATLGYGGGDFGVLSGHVYFVSGTGIYRQGLDESEAEMVVSMPGEFSSPTPSPDGKYLAFVHSAHRLDSIQLAPTSGVGEITVLDKESDFYMQPSWHPSGKSVSWISWNHPNMPWDRNKVVLAHLEMNGTAPKVSELQLLSEDSTHAYFQPEFSPDGTLLSVVSDEGGWFNLRVLSYPSLEVVACLEEEAEHGLAAWLQGMRTTAWMPDSSGLYFLRYQNAFSRLGKLDVQSGAYELIGGEVEAYTSFRQLTVSPDGEWVAMIGSGSDIPPRVIAVNSDGKTDPYRLSTPENLPGECYGVAEKVTWKTADSGCHGLYYAPTNPSFQGEDGELPPAIIKIHGGPTSQYFADYAAETQFFTSRGYSVLAVNYRGSTGYGRDYRQALTGAWGVADVEDIRAAADFLVTERLADPNRIVLMGGSAGGYNLLMCFVRYPGVFRAGICRYGVTDLEALAAHTHKFEEHYLDSLIGVLPDDLSIYKERSPITHIDTIQDPLAIFQGDRDKVVPQDQSDLLVNSLKERDVPHVYRVYKGEGHGWRKQETIEDYYRTIEQFLKRYVLS